MRLATLREGGRDGTLILVDGLRKRAVVATRVAPTLQAALDNWERAAPDLDELQRELDHGHPPAAFPLDPARLAAPLPRAYQWADGSAYLSHVERVRRARGAEMPPGLLTDPLMYQGGSDGFLAPTDPIPLLDESWGLDFEAEVAVITGDVPMGATPEEARQRIRLVLLVNDVSLRNLVPAELAKGFGFFQSKPASALSPFALTPDELGAAWDGAKLKMPLKITLNGVGFGRPNAGEGMQFDFPRLIAHAAKTRALAAGSIIGSGTVSNQNAAVGFACIAERRAVETVELGAPRTPFLTHGDRVRIEAVAEDGSSPFGAIEQEVVRTTGAGGLQRQDPDFQNRGRRAMK
ncbi:MAG TPA: fumarylacetoacetate hydrolase family protein [Alphaproteobacteria bacterium]|nr:fumarylacetoacetate hydrolase family protein [Alphaproteobacteria bacterium]